MEKPIEPLPMLNTGLWLCILMKRTLRGEETKEADLSRHWISSVSHFWNEVANDDFNIVCPFAHLFLPVELGITVRKSIFKRKVAGLRLSRIPERPKDQV